MYAYIIDNTVMELIPDFDKAFSNVPVEQRYPAEFLAKCVHIEDSADVKQGMFYDNLDKEYASDIAEKCQKLGMTVVVSTD